MNSQKKKEEANSMDDELEMEEVFVLDTCVILEDPDVFFNLGPKWIVVPTAVIRELDGLKQSRDSKKAVRSQEGGSNPGRFESSSKHNNRSYNIGSVCCKDI